jgi:UDP-2,3-diacylglucosamine pyrophosphatase LpxH
MTVATQETTIGAFPVRSPRTVPGIWRAWAHARLTAVFEAAREIPFDDDSRSVFFSDCHRGDNSRADAFAKNEGLYLHALTHYYRMGYTYFEVGDGDETWKNRRFCDIVNAHQRTFDLLHKFNRQNRLHLVLGNHDINGSHHKRGDKDGLIAEEGFILRHARTGQRIFVVHGHQADFKSDTLSFLGRFAVGHVWRRLQLMGIQARAGKINAAAKNRHKRYDLERASGFFRLLISMIHRIIGTIERRIISWIEPKWQMVICGHTHRPMSAEYGAPPYFNTGSCTTPGNITGLELHNGELALVRWSYQKAANSGKALPVERQLLTPARQIRRWDR